MPTSVAHLSPFDLALVALYLVAITVFGLRFSRKNAGAEKSLKSYFLADNVIPWWAIALSIVSAETSTLTIISIPGVAFAGDFGFLQVVLGYMIGRVVVAVLFLPRYFRGEMLTAYQLIDRRFGSALHKLTAGLFLLTRAAAEGVRVFAISIVVGIAIGTGDTLSIAIISALTLLYTFEGGMAAVIWTDVVQMALYILGTLAAIFTLGAHVPGGWTYIHTVAAPLGKFHMLNFALNLTSTYTFWAGVLGGTFLTMASHGTDQLMVQRMLAARNLRESRLALLSSGVGHLLPVHLIFADWRGSICVLRDASAALCFGGSDLPELHRARDAARRRRAADRGDPGGGDEQSLRGVELAREHLGGRFLHAASSPGRGAGAHTGLALDDGVLGGGALCDSGLQHPGRGQGACGRDRAFDRVGGVWLPARRVPAWHSHSLCDPTWSDSRNDLWTCG